MAKDTEKQIAQSLYIDQCLTAKEIAIKLSVSEKTVGAWVDKGNWRELRVSKHTTPDSLIAKYNELLTILLDKRLKAEKTSGLEDEEGESVKSIIDEMSKVSAMIERLQTEGRLTLRTHIQCLEMFTGALHKENPKLFMQLIDFQKQYLTTLVDQLK